MTRTAQDVLNAIDAFLGRREFDRAGYRVEQFNRSNSILWRGKRIVAAMRCDRVVWVCDGRTYDGTAWLRGEDGAKNELLSLLLAMRWPRNYADRTSSERRLREFRDGLIAKQAADARRAAA